MKTILRSSVATKKTYLYSDLGYYFLKKIIEKRGGESLENYVSNNFYKKLGLTTMTYLPRTKFSIDRIPPTEYDIQFRKQLIQGDVHDQGAAMMGGVAGHAGLFSNAKDLGVLMQMYLNKGQYGGERYINESTVKEFTSCQFCNQGNRRALGFDKPEPDLSKDSPVCRCVSASSYGHSGFTGTFTWVDPDKQLVYVFLSNRVYPDAENKKLVSLNTRSRIHQEICNLFLR
jgi:CubicO group peptidase (beta-lactamase class C family)